MNRKVIFYALLPCLLLQFSAYAQVNNKIKIKGTVKSVQGAVQGALVEFYLLNNEYIGSCSTDPYGRFISETPQQVGLTVRIEVTKTGFKILDKDYKIDKNGDAGEFMLKVKNTISGYVKDSMTDRPLQGVDIQYYDQAKLVQKTSTNSAGYFDFDTNLGYGDKITVRASRKDYYAKEQTQVLTLEGDNRLGEILLPEFSARGMRAFIHINDKKTGKPISGASLRYLDRKRSTYRDTTVSSIGQVELNLYQRPGTTLDMQIMKPSYRTMNIKATLSEDLEKNNFTYELEKDRRPVLGPILLIGAGATALLSGGMYLSSKKSYDNYKPFENTNRENDYNKAQSSLNIAVAAAGVATGALIGFIITKISQKHKAKALERKANGIGFNQFPATVITSKT